MSTAWMANHYHLVIETPFRVENQNHDLKNFSPDVFRRFISLIDQVRHLLKRSANLIK
jgi:hypothetical protein